MATIDEAREAKEALRAALADREGIAGVGIAPDDDAARVDYVLQVNVESATVRDGVPTQVHGVAVRVRVVGRVEAQRPPDDSAPIG